MVIDALITTRILVQFIGQIGAVTLLRRRAPHMPRPYRMWLYPMPSLVALVGWIFVFATTPPTVVAFGLGALLLGLVCFGAWSWSFFSSRRRHTRSLCDWSSDVCSSDLPAQQALVPLLVPVSMLSRAMALSASSMQVAIIGGPALGGILYVAGDSVVYAVCAALFALAGGFFLAVRHVHMPPPAEPVSMHTVFAGFRFIWQREQVLGAISLDLFAVLLGGAVALLPIYAKDILHVGPS